LRSRKEMRQKERFGRNGKWTFTDDGKSMTGTQGADERCEHFESVGDPPPRANGCEECLALGEPWVAARVCLTCGHVGCCEDSPRAHALAHFQSTGHPIIRPLARRERWTWCYVHHRYFPGLDAGIGGAGGWLRRLLKR
jgi:uncharacterized UBP type Zn finger protein